jgi:hypothetical protein
MTIQLRDYDLTAARLRILQRADRVRGLVMDRDGYVDVLHTKRIRELDQTDLDLAIRSIQFTLMNALSHLHVELGGTVAQVPGGYAALRENLHPRLPLVHALMILRGHPRHPGYHGESLHRWEQAEGYPHAEIGQLLEDLYSANPLPWDLEVFERTVLDGARRYCGEVDVEPDWDPAMIYPGAPVNEYTMVLEKTILFDAFGAFDPAFTRADALVGEWWLLQPVSPRLQHHFLARELALYFMGILPQTHVDAAGRVVMACFPTSELTEQQRIEAIEDSKWIAGWKKVVWTKNEPPLRDAGFDLASFEGVPEEGPYGPYRHSSELPRWP